MQLVLKKIILPFSLFCGFLALYTTELSKSVYGGDVGDLITASAVGGVAHPSGYPLFTFLGFLLVRSPLALVSPAFAVGFVSSLSAAAGVAGFYMLSKAITKQRLAPLLASLVLGFSFLYWFYAETAEVFALNAFFAVFLFLFAIFYKQTKKTVILYAFIFLLGLSCTNHQTIILLFPSLLLIIGKQAFIDVQKKPRILSLILITFLLGLTPFIYIVIASAHNPIINWDNVHDLSSFLRLILRKDYGTFQAGLFDSPSLAQRIVILRVYFEYLITQLTIPVVLLVLFGFWQLLKKEKVISLAIFLAWILSGPIFLFYAGFPLLSGFIIGASERFILLSSVIFLIPFSIGLISFSQFLARLLPKRRYDMLFQYIFFLIPIMLFVYNFPKTNLASVTIGDTYAKDFLTPLPRNAIFLVSGDTQIFNTWYVHFVLHVRPDVLLYNIGATPITHNIIADSIRGIAQKDSTEAVIQTVEALSKTRPVFSTNQFQPKKGGKITWVPYGLVHQMYLDKTTLPDKKTYEDEIATVWAKMRVPTQNDFKNPANHSLTIATIPTDYSNALIATGTFIYSQYKDIDMTLRLYNRAVAVAPDNEQAYAALGTIYTGIPGKCNEAVVNLSQSIALNSYQELPYFLLYNEYTTCFKDKKKADAVASEFTDIFQKDFQKELQKSKNNLQLTSLD